MDRWRVEAQDRGERTIYVVVLRNEAHGDTIGGDVVYVDRDEAQEEANRLNRILDEGMDSSS
jgi:hypothetical protein